MNKEFIEAIDQLEKERGISQDLLFEAIESALISAYKKNYGVDGNVEVRIDRVEGDIEVVNKLDVVADEDLVDDSTQIALSEAQAIDPEFEVGDQIEYEVTPMDFGRIAAQTAKQVVVQRIREAERGMIYNDYIGRVGDVITGTVARKSNETIYVNLGRAEGILSVREQVPGEKFNVQDRIRVYIMDVKNSTRGPQVFLSRSHPGLVKRLFEMEVPEIEDGVVEIKGMAREAGSRTKMTVWSSDENVDPVGACVGSRGSRVQSVLDELFNEKIDIIPWSEDAGQLVINVLSPAKVEAVYLDQEMKIATAVVPDYQLSLAIGKSGQNVRLAAKLCGWKIDIKSHTQYYGDEELEDEDLIDEDVEEIEEIEEAPAEETVEEAAEEVAEEAAEETEEVAEEPAEAEEAAEEEAPAEEPAEAPAEEEE